MNELRFEILKDSIRAKLTLTRCQFGEIIQRDFDSARTESTWKEG
jgi:hypothetical protein